MLRLFVRGLAQERGDGRVFRRVGGGALAGWSAAIVSLMQPSLAARRSREVRRGEHRAMRRGGPGADQRAGAEAEASADARSAWRISSPIAFCAPRTSDDGAPSASSSSTSCANDATDACSVSPSRAQTSASAVDVARSIASGIVQPSPRASAGRRATPSTTKGRPTAQPPFTFQQHASVLFVFALPTILSPFWMKPQ